MMAEESNKNKTCSCFLRCILFQRRKYSAENGKQKHYTFDKTSLNNNSYSDTQHFNILNEATPTFGLKSSMTAIFPYMPTSLTGRSPSAVTT